MLSDRCVMPPKCGSLAAGVCEAADAIEVWLCGEIDHTSVYVVDDLGRLFGRGHRLMRVDLGAVTFLGACGIASLLDLQSRGRMSDCEVGFTNARGIVARVIAICGLEFALLGADFA